MLNDTVFKSSDLHLHWFVIGVLFCLLVAYNLVCLVFGAEIQIFGDMTADQRVFIRSIFYVIAIVLFPLVNLLRYILLRLNITMKTDTSAKTRYFMTVFTCLMCIESVGILGFILFILGDEVNSLYIFSLLGLLGLFIHRPKPAEYQYIIDQLPS